MEFWNHCALAVLFCKYKGEIINFTISHDDTTKAKGKEENVCGATMLRLMIDGEEFEVAICLRQKKDKTSLVALNGDVIL